MPVTIISVRRKHPTVHPSQMHFRLVWPFVASETSDKCGRFSVFIQLLLFSAGLVCVQPACAQNWQWTKTINVGTTPERAVLLPGGRELYVSNRTSCNISIIDTEENERIANVELGMSPKAMVASHDGRRVYVLVERNQSCPGEFTANGAKSSHSLAIITTADRSVTYVALPGQRWDELAVTRDGRVYMTQVVDGEQRYAGAVYVFDTEKNELGNMPVIQDDIGCPVGIAISNDEQRLYVNYQCYGPGGRPESPAHDSIGVYQLPSHKLIQVIAGLPNVGGQLALSPDGSQLWAEGNDACSRPDYPHTDACPGFPVRVVNAIRTSDLRVISYGLALEDFNGRISLSPEGDAFVGGGTYLKEIPSHNLKEISRHNPLIVNRLPIANVGEVAFRGDIRAEYMYVTVRDRNLVYVMLRTNNEIDEERATEEQLPIAIGDAMPQLDGKTAHVEFHDVVNVRTHDKASGNPAYAPVSQLSLANVLAVLSEHAGYGKCAETENNPCIRVLPQAMAPVLFQRADKGVELDRCGQPEIKPADVYRCVANVVLSAAPADGTGRVQAIDQAMELRALEANEDFMEFRVEYLTKKNELARLDHKADVTRLTLEEQQRRDHLRDDVTKYEQDSRAFNDATLRLSDPSKLQKSLGSSAVALGVFSWGKNTYTVLISKDEEILQEDGVDWNTLSNKVHAFRDKLSNEEVDTNPPAAAKDLYDMLIGQGKVSEKLKQLKALAPQQNLTLVWVTEGELQNIPMAALSSDGQHFLVESYSNAVLTTPSAPKKVRGQSDWRGLAAGDAVARPQLGLPELSQLENELQELFSDPESPKPGTIPAMVLLNTGSRNDFTNKAFSDGLRMLAHNNEGKNLLVFIAGHFALTDSENTSRILTADATGLTLWDMSHENQYPFRGVNLVTFSACDTTKEGESAGKEIEGLAYYLDDRGNGARSVLATLWEIDPVHSTPLMKIFHDGLQQGIPKAEALRKAEVSLLHLRPPTHWAAFILIGDWR